MANQCRQLADLLGREDVRVLLVRSNAPYRPRWIGRVRWVREPFRLFPYLADLWRTIRGAEVAHLFANSGWSWYLVATPAILIARMRGIPLIVNYRGGNAESFFSGAPFWATRTLAAADSVIVPSRYLQGVFEKLGLKPSVIPNVIDLDRFTSRSGGEEPRLAQHIVITRNLERVYDIPTAIRAFALVRSRFPQATLTIAGAGPELAPLENLCRSLGLAGAVRFAGPLDPIAVARLYRSATLMLNPSLVDNMPNSVLEAFASGTAVVSTNVGGVPFIAEHERTALLVEPGDYQAMAAAVLRLLDDAPLLERLTRSAYDQVQHYGWPRVRELWLAEYARLAHTRKERKDWFARSLRSRRKRGTADVDRGAGRDNQIDA